MSVLNIGIRVNFYEDEEGNKPRIININKIQTIYKSFFVYRDIELILTDCNLNVIPRYSQFQKTIYSTVYHYIYITV